MAAQEYRDRNCISIHPLQLKSFFVSKFLQALVKHSYFQKFKISLIQIKWKVTVFMENGTPTVALKFLFPASPMFQPDICPEEAIDWNLF